MACSARRLSRSRPIVTTASVLPRPAHSAKIRQSRAIRQRTFDADLVPLLRAGRHIGSRHRSAGSRGASLGTARNACLRPSTCSTPRFGLAVARAPNARHVCADRCEGQASARCRPRRRCPALVCRNSSTLTPRSMASRPARPAPSRGRTPTPRNDQVGLQRQRRRRA